MENKNNKTIWIVLGVIVLGLIVWYFVQKNSVPVGQPVATTPDAMQADEDTTVGSVNTPPTTGVAPVTLSYQQALLKYKNARLQIADQCQVSHLSDLTFKNNSNIMIDNRSKVAHTLKVGSTFSVKAYGFKIVNLSSAKLPATWLVDCDSHQNIATILIQK